MFWRKDLLPLLSLLFLILFFFTSSQIIQKNKRERKIMSNIIREKAQAYHFVLVHGYGSGAWCWYKVATLLESSGHKVTWLDLKGAGIDESKSEEIHTFEAYNEPLVNLLAELPDTEHVILVGLSAGGLSVTEASHRFSKKIKVAIYVAAPMLKHGFVTKQDIEDGVPRGLQGGKSNQTTPSIIPPEDQMLTRMLSRPVPLEALLSARFEGDNAESVRRVFIKTLYDNQLLPEQQDAMIRRWPPSEVLAVESDHDIVFTNPSLLFESLVEVANMCSKAG